MNITTNITIDGRDFVVSEHGLLLSEEILREHGVVVESLHLEAVVRWEDPYARKALEADGVSVETHVSVADYYEDLSGWCDFENKFEYYHDEKSLVVPRHLVAAASRPQAVEPAEAVYWDEAASLGYADWAA